MFVPLRGAEWCWPLRFVPFAVQLLPLRQRHLLRLQRAQLRQLHQRQRRPVRGLPARLRANGCAAVRLFLRGQLRLLQPVGLRGLRGLLLPEQQLLPALPQRAAVHGLQRGQQPAVPQLHRWLLQRQRHLPPLRHLLPTMRQCQLLLQS